LAYALSQLISRPLSIVQTFHICQFRLSTIVLSCTRNTSLWRQFRFNEYEVACMTAWSIDWPIFPMCNLRKLSLSITMKPLTLSTIANVDQHISSPTVFSDDSVFRLIFNRPTAYRDWERNERAEMERDVINNDRDVEKTERRPEKISWRHGFRGKSWEFEKLSVNFENIWRTKPLILRAIPSVYLNISVFLYSMNMWIFQFPVDSFLLSIQSM